MHRTAGTYLRYETRGRFVPSFSLRWRLLFVAGLVVVGVLAGISYWYTGVASIHATQSQSFPIQHHATMIITDNRGNISLHSGVDNSITVQVTKHAVGIRPDMRNMSVKMSKAGNGDIVIVDAQDRLQSPDIISHGIDLDITVPALIDFTIVSQSGEVLIDGVKGAINVHAEDGSINAANIRGQGTVTLQAPKGAIDIDNLSGAVSLSTQDGHIYVGETILNGQSTLISHDGDIAFDGIVDPSCRCTFAASGGSVDLTLPSISDFDLYVMTKYGQVNNEFGSVHVGSLPRAYLSIRTSDGDITLNENNN